jgi:hypothetical protein
VSPTTKSRWWNGRSQRFTYFVGAVFLHLVIFVLVATVVVFQAQQPPSEATFLRLAIPKPPPPPPQPPAATGGTAANNLEPDITVAPTPAPLSVVTTSVSSFTLPSAKADLSRLPMPATKPSGTDLTGNNAPGSSAGADNPFGTTSSGGSDELVGFMYDFKQTSDRKPTGMTPDKYHAILTKFVAGGWNESSLENYYKSPNPIFASHVLVPDMDAGAGPKAFGLEKEIQPKMWIVWYRAKLSPPATGVYRFAGFCDDILLVRVDGQNVLDGSIDPVIPKFTRKTPWPNDWVYNRVPAQNYGKLRLGAPVSLTQGDPVDIDIIIGEQPGGKFNASLFVVSDGVDYPRDAGGEPQLPLFQTSPAPQKIEGDHPPILNSTDTWTK